MCAVFVFIMYMQECGKVLQAKRGERLNRVDLYGKNLIPMQKLLNLLQEVTSSGVAYVGPMASQVPTPMLYAFTMYMYIRKR